MDRTEYYFEGQEAARQGMTDADCPYAIGTDEAMDWQDGLMSVIVPAQRSSSTHETEYLGWKARTKLLAIDLKLQIHSEPFGRRGVCIDVWDGDKKLGFRKSWKAAYALVKTAMK